MFNEEMSKCEQGSKLSWDDTNKKVVMEGNTSDKCYVFFDKYSPIKINNYSITSSGNKITITIDADVLQAYRESGKGYQARMNDALRNSAIAEGWLPKTV